jgi:hypothetical protein
MLAGTSLSGAEREHPRYEALITRTEAQLAAFQIEHAGKGD